MTKDAETENLAITLPAGFPWRHLVIEGEEEINIANSDAASGATNSVKTGATQDIQRAESNPPESSN